MPAPMPLCRTTHTSLLGKKNHLPLPSTKGSIYLSKAGSIYLSGIA